MRHLHLFEFLDQPWYPPLFRRMQADYLQAVATRGAGPSYLVPLICKVLHASGTTQIVDLCSGASGPWARLAPQLAEAGVAVIVKLTDRYPSPDAIRRWADSGSGKIEYVPNPVDALDVPSHLVGMRTIFEGFHHFRPAEARAILQNAVLTRAPIGVFDMTPKAPLGIPFLLLAPLSTLLAYWLLTPLFRPLGAARLFWTYLVPLVPLATCWDGLVSFARTYSPPQLRELTAGLRTPGYVWEAGQAPTGTPFLTYNYLLGYPDQGISAQSW